MAGRSVKEILPMTSEGMGRPPHCFSLCRPPIMIRMNALTFRELKPVQSARAQAFAVARMGLTLCVGRTLKGLALVCRAEALRRVKPLGGPFRVSIGLAGGF